MNDAGLTLCDRLRVLRRDVLRRDVLRRDALRQLGARNGVDAGLIELAAHVGAVLVALEAEALEAIAPVLGDRALIVDDNATVQLVVYSADKQAAAATLTPAAAIRLGNQLVAAGARRL